MKIRFLLILFLAGVLTLGFSFWWRFSTQALNPEDKRVKIFTIGKGENVRQVTRRLKEEGLIRSKIAFFLLIKKSNAEKKIQAGTFRLSPSMTPEKILEEFAHGTLDIWLTVIEGWRNEEIARLLEEKLGLPPEDFLKVAKVGYMFPDTYAFPKEASAASVARKMLVTFESKFGPKLKERAQKEGLTEKEVIILASMVEREVKYADDRPKVAGILLNRLRQEMPLQVDATVQYALASLKCKQSVKCDWWLENLTREDLEIDSPYNTYLNVDLPPTPISNPGLASIEALVYPTKTAYLYYLSDHEGKMHYAQTLEEHNENIRKYLTGFGR